MVVAALCVIPARGGSKRVPRKNVAPFCGRPMIEWPIAAAIASGVFDRIVVSTDDDEIAHVARAAGAEVPFKRPAALSGDEAATIPVVRHAIAELYPGGERPAATCCLYATAPFVRPTDLRQARDLLEGADFVIPVGRFPAPVQRALVIDGDGRLRMQSPENYAVRSQDLPETYFDAGQFYWAQSDAWFGETSPYGQRVRPLPLPRERVQDIDTPEDWAFAELLFRAQGLDQADMSRGAL